MNKRVYRAGGALHRNATTRHCRATSVSVCVATDPFDLAEGRGPGC